MEPQALGRLLRQSREAKELTLDEAERALRIRRRILESFEVGDFVLPEFAPIQLRGFVRNYARYLGLDEDRILTFYEEALEELAHGGGSLAGRRRGRKRASSRKKRADSADAASSRGAAPTSSATARQSSGLDEPRRGGGLLAGMARVLVAIAAVIVILLGAAELLRTDPGEGAGAEANDLSDILGALPVQPTFTPLPIQTTATPTLALLLQPGFTGQGVLVSIEITQRTYLRVFTDGVSQFDGLARTGDLLEFPAGGSVTISAGNAEALRIVYNGERQPIFGDRGQKVDLTFTLTGVEVVTGSGFEPTSEIAPTPLPPPTPGVTAVSVEPTSPPLLLPTTAEEIPTSTVGVIAAASPVAPLSTLSTEPTPLPGAAPLLAPTMTAGEPAGMPTPLPGVAPMVTTPTVVAVTATRASTTTRAFTSTPLPTLTETPSLTPIPSETRVPSPSAIVPPRGAPPGATPTKIR